MVIGFAEGAIPEVKVNRLLLRNVDVCGCVLRRAGHPRPNGFGERRREAWSSWFGGGAIQPGWWAPSTNSRMAAAALRELAERRATGKVVLTV